MDWDKAARLEPQPDEPWHRANQRQPDMILTAENGWTAGEWGYGENKKKALQEALNQHLIEEGKEPVDWGQDGPDKVEAQSCRGRDEHHSRREEPTPSPQERSGPRLRSL